MLHLYEYEGCPFCRNVRQALAAHTIDCIVFPCPRGGQRFRPQAIEVGGRQQFPLLVDPEVGLVQYESRAIIDYLETRATHDHAPVASLGQTVAGQLSDLSGFRGIGRHGRRPSAHLFELYFEESSLAAHQVRMLLGTLELAYIRRSPSVLAAQRDSLPDWVRRSAPDCIDAARPNAPVLIDSNTQTARFGAGDIAAYLEQHY